MGTRVGNLDESQPAIVTIELWDKPEITVNSGMRRASR